MSGKYSIKQVECFDLAFCQKVVETIYQLKEEWTPRMGGEIPFYTLGAASYIDHEKYPILAKKKNPILLQYFSELYIRLAQILQKEIGEIVKYEEKVTLPGFHIFEFHPIFEQPVAACHFDLQYQNIEWPYRKVAYDRPISFTLALELPKHGGGLNYWDLEYENLKGKPRYEVEKLKENTEQKYIPYKVGSMIVQEGLFLHQIAQGKNLEPTDKRITLQGHGLICDGALRIYW